MLAIDVLVVWFLILGIPLSWQKGFYSGAEQAHTWIGVQFKVKEPGIATLSLPQDFAHGLLELAKLFASSATTTASMKQAQELCGKAGRVAQVLPSSRPFLMGLYGALAGSLNAARHRAREAPPGRVATRRYRFCASWLVALLSARPDAPLVLSSEIQAKKKVYGTELRVEFDASPWGGAGILFEKGEASEYFVVTWSRIARLNVSPGDSAHQTFWECLTLALCLVRWCPIKDNVLFCGDNTASLNLALSMKGTGTNGAIASEIAWRAARYRWSYAVAHLPSEANKVAYRMSRLCDPSLPPLVALPSALENAAEISVSVDELWSLATP